MKVQVNAQEAGDIIMLALVERDGDDFYARELARSLAESYVKRTKPAPNASTKSW